MSLPLRQLGAADSDWHPGFCISVREVFRRADFRRWIAWGEWGDGYTAFVIIEGERIVANAAVTRMELLVAGAAVDAYQIGAVFCLPARRGRGLARRALQAALEHCGNAPVLLFGNPAVRDFYPRFGFAPREEHLFVAEHACVPSGAQAPTLDPCSPEVRARIHGLAAQGVAESERFGARGHGRIITWYCANGFARPLRELSRDLLVVAGIEGETLHIDGVLATSEQPLAPLLPRLIDRPIRRVRFGFTPDRWWPAAHAIGVDPEPDLFLRGFDPLPPMPHKFPLLAQT